MDILFGTKQKNEIEVLCSAPEANSFFQGGVFKKYIPYFYRCFEHSILTKSPETKISEFNNGKKSLTKANGHSIQKAYGFNKHKIPT